MGISVIIPVYNAERQVEQCIESLLKQGKVIEEILCVDDGSTDLSVSVIKKLQKQDKRIQLFSGGHYGVSHARNIGLEKATAEYLLFVDADDYVIQDTLAGLYRKVQKTKADILVFGGRAEDVWHSPDWIRRAFSPKNKSYCKKSKKEILMEPGILPSACNKLYRRKLVQSLRFSEELSIAEDNVFQFLALIKAERVISVSKRAYVYCLHGESALATVSAVQKEEQHEKAVEIVKKYLEEQKVWEIYQDAFHEWRSSLTKVNRTNLKKRISWKRC